MTSRPLRKSLVGPAIMCSTEPDESVSTFTSNDAAPSLPLSWNVAEAYCGVGAAKVGSESSLLLSRKRLTPKNSPEAIAQTARRHATRLVARPAREGFASAAGLAGAPAPWARPDPFSARGCALGGRAGCEGTLGNDGLATTAGAETAVGGGVSEIVTVGGAHDGAKEGAPTDAGEKDESATDDGKTDDGASGDGASDHGTAFGGASSCVDPGASAPSAVTP